MGGRAEPPCSAALHYRNNFNILVYKQEVFGRDYPSLETDRFDARFCSLNGGNGNGEGALGQPFPHRTAGGAGRLPTHAAPSPEKGNQSAL